MTPRRVGQPAGPAEPSIREREIHDADRPPDPILPETPATNAADRTRVSTPDAGGMTVVGTMAAAASVPSPAELFTRLKTAVMRSEEPERMIALEALERLETTTEGFWIAAALLLHRRRDTLGDGDLANLPKKVRTEVVVPRLAFWLREPDAAEALAGVPPELYQPLANAFLESDDREAKTRAAAYIRTTRRERSTWMIRGFLSATGELVGGPAELRIQDPERALASLARRQRGLELQQNGRIPLLPDELLDLPADVTALSGQLQAADTRVPPPAPAELRALDEPAASELARTLLVGRMENSANRRGVLGELLRLRQLQSDPATAGRILCRGLRLMTAPQELRAVRTYEAAVAWCKASDPPVDTNMLCRVQTADGFFYALSRTELDLAVFEPKGNRLRPLRLENVKAGLDNASQARAQNRVAMDTLSDRDGVCVLAGPDERGVYREITGLLDLGEEALGSVALATVGPKDDHHYDVALPLTGWDLSQLSLRLLG